LCQTTLVNNISDFCIWPSPIADTLPAFKYCAPVNTFNWTEFIGKGVIEMKICNPNGTTPVGYCQHTLDHIGLPYNMFNAAQNGTFKVCNSGLMDIPGEYTSGGQTLSYAQPAESVSIGSFPYTPHIPSARTVKHNRAPSFLPTLPHSPPLQLAPQLLRQAQVLPVQAALTANPTKASGSNGAQSVTISLFTTHEHP
jgi:hypothetical protein